MADMPWNMMMTVSQGKSLTAQPFSQRDKHEQAAIVHENVNNGSAQAHQQIAETHRETSEASPSAN